MLVAMLVGTKSGINWLRAQLAEPESKLKLTPNLLFIYGLNIVVQCQK